MQDHKDFYVGTLPLTTQMMFDMPVFDIKNKLKTGHYRYCTECAIDSPTLATQIYFTLALIYKF